MIIISRSMTLADNEVTLKGIRAQGAGGQYVNRASTAIHLHSNIRVSSLPELYKERLLVAGHRLIPVDGVVIIKTQKYRSQEMNHEAATARLVASIKESTAIRKSRRETRPTRASKERCLASEAQKSSAKALRGRVRQ